MYKYKRRNVIPIFVFLIVISCSKLENNYVDSSPKPIIWDTSTLVRISDPHTGDYARILQLPDESLFAVYSDGSGIVGKRSFDLGKTWIGKKIIIQSNTKNYLTNAEINQLDDGSIMVWVNYRVPQNNTDTSRRLMIGFVKSTDNGNSWSNEHIVFRASHTWEQGCWEPKALQLPSGELQVYFANEYPYGGISTEQEISILSSFDNGETWTTTPKKISFRQGFRDGMPVPLLLQNKKEIIMAIEDNGYFFLFKPSIIRTTLADNWSSPVLANSPKREYALKEIIPPGIGPYSGAPYIAQLPSGQTILSCQSIYKRSLFAVNEQYAVPLVGVGDENGRNFTYFCQPFKMAQTKQGLWNSITILNNSEIIITTTTNAYSDNGAVEVWMVKGKLKE